MQGTSEEPSPDNPTASCRSPGHAPDGAGQVASVLIRVRLESTGPLSAIGPAGPFGVGAAHFRQAVLTSALISCGVRPCGSLGYSFMPATCSAS